MGRDHRRRSQAKRRFRQIEGGENDEETVDDLAHAAQFAVFPTSVVAAASLAETGDPIKEEDDNEIEVGEDDDDDDSDASVVDAAPNADDTTDDDDDSECESEDNESDDDLAEALMRMERASAEDEAKIATASNPPKTENEVDGYKVPIQELESQLQIQLTVDGGKGNMTATNNGMDISMNEVSLAGQIKNYMILDRTVVVESTTNSSSPQKCVGPLDEGSLLVVKKPNNPNDDRDASKPNWIPLGRIFEVFGPVSQPLYTIRLPSPPSKDKKRISDQRSSKKNAKEIDGGVHSDEEDKTQVGVDQNDVEATNVDNTESSEIAAVNTGNGPVIKNEEGSSSEEKSSEPQTTTKRINEPEKTVCLPSPSNMVESVTKDESPSNDESEGSVIDPWAMDGEYAEFLSQNKDIEVFYIQDEAKIIDTGLVLRTSGKGCDASNIYDEEILDSSEAYYSDDEKEREAKNKRKGATRKKRHQGNNGNRPQSNQPRSRNFHQQNSQHNNFNNFANTPAPGQYQFRSNPPPPPPPPQGYGYGQHTGNLPSGFHHMRQQGGFPQTSTLYQYPAQSAFHGQSSIPPPPPPPPNQQHPYQRATPPSSMPPPPPPPRNPNEPPAYQY